MMSSTSASIGRFGLFALLAIFLVSPTVSGHADYLSSNPGASEILPSAPASVEVTFTEVVQPGSASIRVTNETGERFDVGGATLSENHLTASIPIASAGPGVYTVTWVTVSAVDGHSTSGSFGFVVQNADGSLPGEVPDRPAGLALSVSPPEIVLRFIGFVGLSLALGAAMLGALIWVPAGRDPDALGSPAYRPSLWTVLHWGRVGAFAYGMGMFGLWIQVVGFDSNLSAEALLGSPFLLSVLGRGILAIAMFIVLSAAFARFPDEEPAVTGARLRVALFLTLAAIALGSAGTHAAADTSFGPLGILANAAHLTGAASWVGGLAGIVLVRRFLRDPAATALARHVYARFSRLAGTSVALVLGGGTVLALLLVESLEGLAATPYGWVVLAKFGLFAPMVAVGAFNRYRLLPGLAGEEDAPRAVRRLTRNVRAESVIGASVLALAALLTAMVPASTVIGPSGPFAVQATADGLRWDLFVYPYPRAPGTYTLSFFLYNATDRHPFVDVKPDSGNLTIVLVDGAVNRTERLDGPHSNHLFLRDVALDRPGQWRLDATIVRVDGVAIGATFYVPVGEG